MERRIPTRLPDAINASPDSCFTQIRNDMLRDPRISCKAKGILCILLSNQSGWVSHLEVLQSICKDGRDSIRSGLKELEEAGYFVQAYYRDKKNKKIKGSFWAYTDTPGKFNLEKHMQFLEDNGLEITQSKLLNKEGAETENPETENPNSENPNSENPNSENPNSENPTLKILIDKNTKDKNTNMILFSDLETSKDSKDKKTNKIERYVPLAEKLAFIIRKNKRINVTPQRISSWANEIRKLVETDGVSIQRVETALDWYEENIGGQYVPVIESGFSLRSKFIKLEDAMRRSGVTPGQPKANSVDTPKDPKKVLRQFFRSKDLAHVFYRDCYEPAEALFEGTVDGGTLAETLLHLYSQIKEKQEQHLKGDLVKLLPGPMELIARYIDWIRDNTWITDIRLDMFDLNHSLFSRFRRDEAKTDNFERDAITGKSYLRG